LGEVLLIDQKVAEARQALEQSRRLAPKDDWVCLNLAHCETSLGNTNRAVELLKSLAENDRAENRVRAHALLELGRWALYDSRREEAVEYFEAALALEAHDGETHHLLATALSRSGRADAAEKHFQQSQRIFDLQRQIRELTNQVMAEHGKIEARFEIASLLHELGRDDEARRWLLTVIHLDPSHAQAHAALARFLPSSPRDNLSRERGQLSFRAPPAQSGPSN
jgi:Flp pilus assembly protein TadD